MNRRRFIKDFAIGAVSLPFIARAIADQPSYAMTLPTTPFDAPAGTWSMVVMPDSQDYAAHFPAVYRRQCEWIVAHRKAHNILFVAHEGDITNDNTPEQWQNAREAMTILNAAAIPYSLLPGNHDLGPVGHRCADRSTLLNQYFHESDFAASPAYGLFEPGKLENNWHAFDTPTGKRLLLALEFAPRDLVVEWANEVVAKHPEHKVVLVTHAFLYSDSKRYDWAKYGKKQNWSPRANTGLVKSGGANDAEDLWQKLIAKNRNVEFILSGHVLHNGTGYLSSRGEHGQTVHQILANYQASVQTDDGAGGVAYDPSIPRKARAFGGGGFLRLMQFWPDGRTVQVKTYSPWYDRWLTQPDQQFSIS